MFIWKSFRDLFGDSDIPKLPDPAPREESFAEAHARKVAEAKRYVDNRHPSKKRAHIRLVKP